MVDKVQKKLMIPEDVADQLELEARVSGKDQSEIGTEALKGRLGSEDADYLEQRLDELESREKQLEQEIETREQKLDDVRQEKSMIRKRLEQLESGDVFTDDHIDEVREYLESGKRLFPNHHLITEIADDIQVGEAKAHESLQDRLQDEYDYPDMAFRVAKGGEDPDWKREMRKQDERGEK